MLLFRVICNTCRSLQDPVRSALQHICKPKGREWANLRGLSHTSRSFRQRYRDVEPLFSPLTSRILKSDREYLPDRNKFPAATPSANKVISTRSRNWPREQGYAYRKRRNETTNSPRGPEGAISSKMDNLSQNWTGCGAEVRGLTHLWRSKTGPFLSSGELL